MSRVYPNQRDHRMYDDDNQNDEQPDQPVQLLDISRVETDRLDLNWRPREQFISRTILNSAQQAQRDEEERCAQRELTSLLQAYIPVQRIPRLIEAKDGQLIFDLSMQTFNGLSGFRRLTGQFSPAGAYLYRHDTSGSLAPMEAIPYFVSAEEIVSAFYALLMSEQRSTRSTARSPLIGKKP